MDMERHAKWWRNLLSEIGRTSAAVSLVAAAACGSTHAPMEPGPDGGMGPDGGSDPVAMCESTGWAPFGEGFAPADPSIDYVALLVMSSVPGAPPSPTIAAYWGTACASATDAAACQAALESRTMSMMPGDSLGRWLLYTDADGYHEVPVDDTAGLRAVLGDVEDEDDAMLRAWLAGYDTSCGWGSPQPQDGGFLLTVRRVEGERCGGTEITYRVELFVAADGTLTERNRVEVSRASDDSCAFGRFPQHLLPLEPEALSGRGGDLLGTWFGEVARLEAAAVTAFEELAAELEHHGAPAELVAWARRSAEEEVRHAELTAALARRFGAEPLPARTERAPVRSLEAIALDNAVEGLVRETYGAAVAHHQAARAEDPAVRAAMEVIAEDESRHAAFSWALHEWLLPRLSEEARARVREALREAAERFEAQAAEPIDERLRRVAGLPSEEASRQMLRALRARVWAN